MAVEAKRSRCGNRALRATQSVKFLKLVWAVALGWLVFADPPSRSTLTGGIVICGATRWIARRTSRRARPL